MNGGIPVVMFVVLASTWHSVPAGIAEKHSNDQIRRRLAQPVNLEKGIEANTELKDALEELRRQSGVNFVVDGQAFRADLCVEQIESQPTKLPPLVGVPLRSVLRLLLQQITGTFRIRDGYVEITTPDRVSLQPESDGRPAALPLVDMALTKRPLDEVLRELSNQSGLNIVIDKAHTGDRSRAAITATFDNVPVDAAVCLVANMAGLRAVVVDNVLYVTTMEKGERLQRELDQREERKLRRKGERP